MELISLTAKNFQTVVRRSAETIQKGGVIIAPTDTVYGLLANAYNQESVNKIFDIKKRAASKPLPIFVKNMAMAKKIAYVSAKQQFFLEQNWPGKTSAVLKRKKDAKVFGVDDKTIALRVPFYPFINSLLETLNLPLTGTSANISGQPSATKIDEVIQQFNGQKIIPDLIINGGDLTNSKPSTIIDLTQAIHKIIRQ